MLALYKAEVVRGAQSILRRVSLTAGPGAPLFLIAEGIERPSQYHWLYEHACDGAQGFYLSEPRRLSELMKRWSPSKEMV